MALFGTAGPLRHCGSWSAPEPWLDAGSGVAIGLLLFAMPIGLAAFARMRSDLPSSWALLVCSGFVLACGVVQIEGAWSTAGAACGMLPLAETLTAALSLGATLFAWPRFVRARAAASAASLAAKNERLRAEIASRVIAESELKLHASELEKARDDARAASRAKSEFLTNMSHEIRTPLNAVIGLSESLLTTELSHDQRENLRTVLDSGEHLLRIVNDILDFSKIESRKLSLERVEFNVADAVGDTLRSFSVEAARKGIDLAFEILPEVPRTLIGDPGRLRQVITHLVSNAITFTESGEVVVRVRVETARGTVDPGFALHFSVEDTGIGIEPDEIARLFESFEQADNSYKRRHGGTGLGLSICRGLVQLLGGSLDAISTPGRGSTFSFTVRFQPGRAPALPDTPDALRGTRVLVVDDHRTTRTILGETLRRHGLRPVLAASGDAALAELDAGLASGAPIPLVLADAQMPEMDGFALAQRVRERAELAGVEIAILSSGAMALDALRCKELRVAARLMKPVKEHELLDAVTRALRRSGPDVPAERSGGAHAPLAPATDPAQSEAGVGVALRVLLVEDSIPNQRVATSMLEGRNHSVEVAGDGQEAIAILGSRDFDVVLMDVQMPLMDGFECTAAIRAAESDSGRHVPIIAMTAHALQGDREKCLAAGMDEYLSKPIRREQLLETLSRLVPQRRVLVNWADTLEWVDGDRQLLRELVETYIEELRDHLTRLPEAIATRDWDETRLRAHSIQSAMGTFGIVEAAQLAQKLERLADAGGSAAAGALLARLERVSKSVLGELGWYAETGWTRPDLLERR